MHVFLQHDWPGNVRELENVIERAVVLSKGEVIGLREIPGEIKKEVKASSHHSGKENLRPLKEIELEMIKQALNIFQGNKSKAAKALGITRKALYKRLKYIN